MANYTLKTPYFDFKKGDFIVVNGHVKTVVGVERIKQYIQKVLLTVKGKYAIYDNYGSDVYNLIGKTYPKEYLLSEIQRTVLESLSACEDIIQIDNISAGKDSTDRVIINVEVTTAFGQIREEALI